MRVTTAQFLTVWLTGTSLFLISCSTRPAVTTDQSLNTPSAPKAALLVKRSQSQTEIDELLRRYQSADAKHLPSGLKSLLQAMVTVPADKTKDLQLASASTQSSSSPTMSTTKSRFIDVGEDYIFGMKKPTLPLRGGFLNNRGSIAPEKASSSQVGGNTPPTTGARFDFEPTPISPRARLREGLNLAKESTDKALVSARQALESAESAIGRGLSTLQQKVATDFPPGVTPRVEPPQAQMPEPQTLVQDSKVTPEQIDPSSSRKADLTQDLQSAKSGFLAKFNRGSYSPLREGIIVIALVLGFMVITWIRLEYEKANSRR